MSQSFVDVSEIPFELGLYQIAPGVYAYLQPDGGWGFNNAGLIVGKDESFLVDTLFDLNHTEAMLEAMSDVTNKAPIVAALNTHENGDHCWGNQLLPPSTKIYAMSKCCEAITREPLDMIRALPNMPSSVFPSTYAEQWLKEIFTSKFEFSQVELRKPNIPLDKSTTIEIGGRKIELLYLGSAHTEGDMVAYVPDAKVLFAGDLLFLKGLPLVWAGPLSSWINILDIFLSMDVDIFVPGHGPLGTKDDVRDVREILSFIVETGTKAYTEGIRDPIALAYQTTLPEKWRNYGEQERLAMNLCVFWREIDPNYKMPDLFELLCIGAEYHKYLQEGNNSSTF